MKLFESDPEEWGKARGGERGGGQRLRHAEHGRLGLSLHSHAKDDGVSSGQGLHGGSLLQRHG